MTLETLWRKHLRWRFISTDGAGRHFHNTQQTERRACTKCGHHNRDAGKLKLCLLCRERARDVAARQRMKHAT